MRHFTMRALSRGLILGASSLMLAACGGGGGDGGGIPGGPEQADHIELRISASRTSLPQNISNVQSSIGGPYTSSVTVEAIARNGSRYVPANGGEDFFACNIIQGIDSVALYYHDGAEEHYTEVDTGQFDPAGNPIKTKVENAYRSITSGANAGAFTFHVASSNKAGTAVVRCSAVDQQSGKQASVEQTFTVGSNSALPTSVRVRDSNSVDYNSSPRSPLYVASMNQLNQLQVQAGVLDETGNPVPDPASGAANLIAEILPSSTATGGSLRVNGQTGQRVMVRTINGIAQVTILAGNTPGALVVLFTGDALDNNVSNGISLPITQTISVPVMDQLVADLQVRGVTPTTGMVNKPYSGAVIISGGYKGSDFPLWCELMGGALPPGLNLATNCTISGTPTAAGSYKFTVGAWQDVDPAVASVETSAAAEVQIDIIEELKVTNGSTSATAGGTFSVKLTATGGKSPYSWAMKSATCAGAAVANDGTVTGTAPATAGSTCTVTATVTDSLGNTADGTVTVTAQ